MRLIKKIIINIFNLFGFQIIKTHTKKYLYIKQNELLFNKKEVNYALISVGREPRPAFSIFNRPLKSSILLNNLENNWWNANSELVEKTWVTMDDVSAKLRNNYIEKAKLFFTENKTKKVNILDLGCGSGWLGRMIADENLQYVGIDFSKSQIDIANQKKEEANFPQSIRYNCIQSIEELKDLNVFDGIICHAFLHHLYVDELNNLFNYIQQNFKQGCKIFVFEPVFYNIDTIKKESLAEHNFNALLNSIKAESIVNNIFDLITEHELNKVISESNYHGYFYSPKEVPFTNTEIISLLEKYCFIENSYLVNTLAFNASNVLGLIKDKTLRENYSHLALSLSDVIHETLLKTGYYPNHCPGYLFTSFECKIKKK